MGIPWVISKTRSIHNPFKFPGSWEAAWAFNSSNGFVGERKSFGGELGERPGTTYAWEMLTNPRRQKTRALSVPDLGAK